MNFNDKIFAELIKFLVMSSNYPFYVKQDDIRKIDYLCYIKDTMNPNDYYRNFIWYSVKDLFVRSGIIPSYY